ncbi:Zinc finger CCHC-type, partial [Arabidopsis suecica]
METIIYSSSDEEDSYGCSQDSYYNETRFVESWHDDGYSSSSDFEEEPDGGAPEPEPPDRYSSHATPPSYSKPWISWNPIPKTNFYPTFYPTRKVIYKLFVHNGSKTYGPEFFLFSGLGYLQWESNMNYYFEFHSTAQEDKLSIALGQLKGSALWWWDQDEYNRWYERRAPIRTWERLKWNMCAKYSPQSLSPAHVVQQKQKPTFLPQMQATTQGKCTFQTKHVELTCYRCKQEGHIAKICPTRETTTKVGLEQQELLKAKEKQEIVSSPKGKNEQAETCQTDLNNSMNVITHLSSAKSIAKVSGTKENITDQGEASTMEKVFTEESKNQGGPTLDEITVNKDESVNDTIQIKGEPSDAQQFPKTQCNLLNPYTLQWTNLTYLCVGKKVLRTKPLEGGDDVRMGADVPADALVDRLLAGFFDGLSDGLPEVLHVSNQLVRTKESYPFLPFCASQSHIWKLGDPLRHPEPFTLNP